MTSNILATYAFTKSTLVKRPLSKPVSSDSVVTSIRIGYRLAVEELHVDVAWTTRQNSEERKETTAKLEGNMFVRIAEMTFAKG